MKKWISLLLAAVMLLSLAACSDNKKKEKTGSNPVPATEASQPTEESTTEASLPTLSDETEAPTESGDVITVDYIRGFDKTPSLEEQVVYDEGGLKVTVKGLNYDPITGVILPVSVSNSSDKQYIVQTACCAVNGFMIATDFSVSSPAKKTTEGEMLLEYLDLAMADIQSIREIAFTLSVLDGESFDVVADAGLITLHTTPESGDEPEYDESGQVAYDAKNIKIILRGINTGKVFTEGDALKVYMVNGTKKQITVQTESVVVNGYDITSAMTTTLLPGMRAVDLVTFYALEMEEYGIEEIDTVEVSFKIMDEATWKTIAKTKKISVEL